MAPFGLRKRSSLDCTDAFPVSPNGLLVKERYDDVAAGRNLSRAPAAAFKASPLDRGLASSFFSSSTRTTPTGTTGSVTGGGDSSSLLLLDDTDKTPIDRLGVYVSQSSGDDGNDAE